MPFHEYAMDASSMPNYATTRTIPEAMSPFIYCASACGMMRAENGACNSFYLNGSLCHLGFIEPSVLVDFLAKNVTGGGEFLLHVDFTNPL